MSAITRFDFFLLIDFSRRFYRQGYRVGEKKTPITDHFLKDNRHLLDHFLFERLLFLLQLAYLEPLIRFHKRMDHLGYFITGYG